MPGDTGIKEVEEEKIGKHQDLEKEIAKLWCPRNSIAFPVVVDALGCATKEAEKHIQGIGINIRAEMIQKMVLLGNARTLGKVLKA